MTEKIRNQNGRGHLQGDSAEHLVATAAARDSRHLRGRTQPFAVLADRVLQLHEELGQARRQLASYGEVLVEIQRSILPERLPNVPGLDLAVHFADVDRVGGDYYDVRPIGPDRWAIVVADVSGHGPAAAAILALVHALGSGLQEQQKPPGRALALINRPLASQYLANTGLFVTAFVGLYDAQTQVLTYASAGHPSPRLVRGNEVRRLDGVYGLPLGINEACVYDEASVQLRPGDRLVLFTDGITESTNAAHEFFGVERLNALLSAPAHSAAELLDHVVTSVRTFRGARPAGDDETCLVAIVNPVQPGKRSMAEKGDHLAAE
jgi:sigma-B regulation protein RsbU (phosphoserine phosphatase)